MKSYVIDTSSLLSFIKYYQPFDTNNQLTKYLQDCFRDGTLILLEAVQNECKRVSGGIIFDNFSHDLEKGKSRIQEITKKQLRKIDDHWAIQDLRKVAINYDDLRKKAIESPDFQLIFYVQSHPEEDLTIVTEETASQNDGKIFKKIPIICKHEEIPCITLPKLLKELKISVSFDHLMLFLYER